jgi:hypothetical protein
MSRPDRDDINGPRSSPARRAYSRFASRNPRIASATC